MFTDISSWNILLLLLFLLYQCNICTVFIRIEAPNVKTKFWGGAFFKIDGPIFIGAADSDNDFALDEDFDYQPMSAEKHCKILIACDKIELSIYVKSEKILPKTGVEALFNGVP